MTPLFEGVGIALASLRAHKGRAALTILGVAIGVMVVMVIGAMISGFNKGITESLESLGPRTFYVGRWWSGGLDVSDGSEETSPWRKRPPLTVEEAERLAQLPSISYVVVDENGSADIEFEGRTAGAVSIQGRNADWPKVAGGDVYPGRSFTHVEDLATARVAVVNQKLAEKLFGKQDPIGHRMKIAGVPFEVIGVFNPPAGLFGEGESAEAFIPYHTLVKYVPYWPGWMDYFVTPAAGVTVQQAIEDVTVALRVMRGLRPGQANSFDVVTQEKYLEALNNLTFVVRLLMLTLSSVGLMVGGVGVVAIMMISVTERTREIGVRKALGATRREILWQFLVEAATLTVVGGIVGMIAGGLISFLIAAATPIPANVPIISVIMALLAAAFTGIVFGLYPASRAARLDPVEALRYE